MVYWLAHLAAAFFGVVLLGVSVRATVTVFLAIAFEFCGFIAMVVPGAAGLPFTLKLFGMLGLASGVPLSLGAGRLPWWVVPALAATVFATLRLSLLVGGDWQTVREILPSQLGAIVGLGVGMLVGRGITDVARSLSRHSTKR